jgi:hypothetical protein
MGIRYIITNNGCISLVLTGKKYLLSYVLFFLAIKQFKFENNEQRSPDRAKSLVKAPDGRGRQIEEQGAYIRRSVEEAGLRVPMTGLSRQEAGTPLIHTSTCKHFLYNSFTKEDI